jgi:photosystem II stability/assembly factor-like uncharacterized protein
MTKPDTVDQKISLLVAELVDSAPLPPPLPDGPAVRRWRAGRRRRLAFRSLKVAGVAAAVAVAVALAVPAGVTPSPHWALAGDITSVWKRVSGIGPRSGFSLTCPSTTTCYADGPGSVEVTRDGGKTWQPATNNDETPLSNVVCSSTGECSYLGASLGSRPVLLQTADAGKTWASRPGPVGLPLVYPKLTKSSYPPPAGPIVLSCPSASTCTLVVPSSGRAFVTKDGGRSWSASSMPTASPPPQLQCFPDARCIFTGGGTGGPLASYSTESGLNWATAIVPSVRGALIALSCSSSETCLAVSWSHGAVRVSLVASDNGGVSWSTLQPRGLPAGKVLTGLACPTASQCWATGDSPVYLGGRVAVGYTGGAVALSSADGGRTWLSTGLPKDIASIGPLSCPNPSTCFALASKTRSTPSSGVRQAPLAVALLVYTA